jgi:hypothetical protein
MYNWMCKQRALGKVDLGYILDESYDHTKLPKIPCREFSNPLIPFSLSQVQKVFC